jgi:hypothetical protein
MTRIFTLIVVLILSMGFAFSQQADTKKKQESEMSIDLPDETEETALVEKGQIQLETSLLYNRYRKAPSSLIGQALLRYGISKRLEIRFLVEDGRQRDQYIKETVQSIYPLAVGAKFSVLKDVKGLPDITLISYLKLPFSSRSSEQKAYWSPNFIVAFLHQFGEKFKLEYNIGVQQDAYDTDWEALANVALHYKLTQNLELATEYYARYQPGENPFHNIGGSLSYQIGNNIEVYVSTGTTIRYEDQNHFFNSGIAFRLP